MERIELNDELVDLGAVSVETQGNTPFLPEVGIGEAPAGLSED